MVYSIGFFISRDTLILSIQDCKGFENSCFIAIKKNLR